MNSGKYCLVAACLLFAILGCGLQQTTLKPKVSFEIYAVVAKPSAETLSLVNEADGKMFVLQSPPIVTEKDVVSATLESDPEAGNSLYVKLSRAGGQLMAAATAVRGKQLAVVIEGQIFSVATIHTTVREDLQLTGEFTPEDIERWFTSKN